MSNPEAIINNIIMAAQRQDTNEDIFSAKDQPEIIQTPQNI